MTKNPPKTANVVAAHAVWCKLKDLVLSPLNVRSEQVQNTELDASLDDLGLLQNLVGYVETDAKKKPTSKIAICAGGSRLLSLQRKMEAGVIDGDYEVPVKIIAVENAVKASLAENKARKDMHPADELKAFLALSTMGYTSKDIAAMFGYAPILITQRLRLATVSPLLMDLFRKGEASLQQLTALCVVDDHARQEAAWNSAPYRSVENLRALVTQGETPERSPLGQYVGKDAYIAAGGEFNIDLFAEDGGGFMVNTPLVHQLALEKLTAEANQIKEKEGLAWVEVSVVRPHAEMIALRDAPTFIRDFSAEELAKHTDLVNRCDAAQLRYEDAEPGSEEEEEAGAEVDRLTAEIEEMEEQRVSIADEHLPRAGVFVWFSNGHVCRSHLKMRPLPKADGTEGDVSEEGDDEAGEGAGIAQSLQEPQKKERSAHSDAHTRRMSAHRNAALQKLVADNHKVALAAMLAAILPGVLSDRDWSQKDSTINIRPPYLKGSAQDIEGNMAWQSVQEQISKAAQLVKAKEGEESSMFSRLLELPEAMLVELVALCVALSIDVLHGNEQTGVRSAELAKAVNLDMADWWKATPDSYLSHVSSKRLLAVVTEAVSAEAANSMLGMKKAQMVEAAALKLSDTRWIPEMMRT
ncbi:ParB/RepB/Spo0J family partition protein [Herbaspirillum huttiense]|uniref:ParB/RepB/Spo0J family partition protein n=1 Tax=Herbaspirillum huttiense TaxID=863372 RepID=UPI002176C968|nr:hypothetical protein [Herbaspirillum huttiense]UWE19321.1 hypothetical protein NY669_26965 [Herbaspirillum huttiense]